jgi:peptidoglycan/LPS O-acetylase OafA/YrhL
MTRHASASTDEPGLGALRAFITVLVLAHHAVLAYHPFAPPPFDSLRTYPFWQAFPVVDSDRWGGAMWLVAVNDTFFMSLMFLISGLFVWRSLERKGSVRYLGDRARRLGLPFVVSVALLAPLAYVPAYLQTGAAASWSGFWTEWLALDSWPAGPAWFLWVLLAFNLVAVALHAVMPGIFQRVGALFACAARRPVVACAILISLSAAAYIPLAVRHGGMHWTSVGPFTVQTSRVIHYAVYFLVGVAIGAGGLDRGLVARGGALATHWLRWLLAGAGAFALAYLATARDFAAGGASLRWQLASAGSFAVACAALSFALLAGFLRRTSIFSTRVLCSLRDNAYGMYVIHYVLVSWLQYALLDAALPGLAKAILVFAGTLLLSWLITATLRRARCASRRPVGRALGPRIEGTSPQPHRSIEDVARVLPKDTTAHPVQSGSRALNRAR